MQEEGAESKKGADDFPLCYDWRAAIRCGDPVLSASAVRFGLALLRRQFEGKLAAMEDVKARLRASEESISFGQQEEAAPREAEEE